MMVAASKRVLPLASQEHTKLGKERSLLGWIVAEARAMAPLGRAID
jgi:hypothetical protein